MKNAGTEILNQVMNRWAAGFRAAQANTAMNANNVESLGIFTLQTSEVLTLCKFQVALSQGETAAENILA